MHEKTTKLLALSMMMLFVAGPAFSGEYKIDPVHSSAMFKVNHMGASNVFGMIPDVSGTVSFDKDNPGKCAIEVIVKPESLSTFNAARDKHLSGPDFFNFKQFPTITFKSTSWKSLGDDRYEVAGNFTMLGVSKPLTLKVAHVGSTKNRRGQTLAGFEATFTIDRTDHGMSYGVADVGGLGKEITITIAIEAQLQ